MKSLIPFKNPLQIRKRWLRKNKFGLRKVGRFLLYFSGALFLFIALLFAWYAKDLPAPGKIKKLHPVESSKILDREGNVLYSVYGEQRRTIIDKKEMPETIKQATIAAEDKDFYKHHGINFRSIIRAAFYNLTHKESIQGGSTITQQYVKNALLSPKRTLSRKIKEVILALEIEAMYSKEDILAMYLNEIPYGSNAYGIEEAAKTYFGKSARDLNLAESAVLAALPKAPTYYSPYGSHPDKLEKRKNYILDRMVALKFISQEEAEKAKKEKITYKPFKENIKAPHFVMYVKEKLIEMYGERMVEEGGLKVTTTLDPKKQEFAEKAIEYGYKRNIKRYGATNAALVAIDPKTGQILAMVGSHDYFDIEHDGQVNVTTSERQPGSAFKPIVYATAFKGRYNPAFTLFDLPTDFGNYKPQNYDGICHGPVSIRQALGNSLNIPAVKILYLAGLDNVLKTAHKMGITTLNQPERYGLSLVLGGGEVKLIDLTTAYGVFANQGILHQTTPILKVEDPKGKVLYEYKPNKGKKEVLDPQIAYQISDILSDNRARTLTFGARSHLYFANRTVAAKTGTTQEFRDAWTIGYTPSLVAGVWVGNNDNTPMRGHAAGVSAAGPIWHQFMEESLESYPNEDFPRPPGIQEITVEKYSNKLPGPHSQELVTDIFASWQVPTQHDDVHITVKICKASGKLATDYCPAEEVEERTYFNLHSELPDNPNWEAPVRAWAEENGIGFGDPPKEKCDIHTAEKQPKISITNPKSEQSVSGNFTISAEVTAHWPIKYVEFAIDNITIATDTTSPYSTTYNANNLSSGEHQLSATAVDQKGMSAKSVLTFNVIKDTTPPGDVSNVTANPGSGKITLFWKNPSDNDLVKIKIYKSLVAGSLGTPLAEEIPASPDTLGSYTVSGLNSGTVYYFTLRPIDTSGNENKSTAQYSATPW